MAKNKKKQGGKKNHQQAHSVSYTPNRGASSARPKEQKPMMDASTIRQQQPAPTVTSGYRNLAQRRAAHALKQIQAMLGEQAQLQKSAKEIYGRYKSYVNGLPANIIRSGLGQALAMERAGKKLKGHEKLFEHLLAWLGNGWEHSPYKEMVNGQRNDAGAKALFAAITSKSEADYIRAQAEVMEYLEWLKKFANAFLEDVKEGEE